MFPFGPGAPSASGTRNSEPWSFPPALVLVMREGSTGATDGAPGAAGAGRASAIATAGDAGAAGAAGASGAGATGAGAAGAAAFGGASAPFATARNTALARPAEPSGAATAPKTALARPALTPSGSSTSIRSFSPSSVTNPSLAIRHGVPTRLGREAGSSVDISCARSRAATFVGLTGAPLTLLITTRLTPFSDETEETPMS